MESKSIRRAKFEICQSRSELQIKAFHVKTFNANLFGSIEFSPCLLVSIILKIWQFSCSKCKISAEIVCCVSTVIARLEMAIDLTFPEVEVQVRQWCTLLIRREKVPSRLKSHHTFNYTLTAPWGNPRGIPILLYTYTDLILSNSFTPYSSS